MGLIPYGLNPDETWQVDFAAERARDELQVLADTVADLREQATRAGAPVSEIEARAAKVEEKAKQLEAELAAYTPKSGPVFTIGPIPNGLRAEIAGERMEISRLEWGAERERREAAWSEKVVLNAVRGHENLRSRSGAAVPFGADSITGPAGAHACPNRKTIEAYQPILHDLAHLCLKSQRLDEAGKNA
jgi:hypothetical protein